MPTKLTFADLSYLESMSMGSQEMINEMIQIFLDQIPEFTDGLKDLLAKEDYVALGALAHKAKSSVAVMGMDDLAGKLKDLELRAKASQDIESYPALVNDFISQIEVTEKEFRAIIA